MIALSTEQTRIVEAPFDASLAVVGSSGTGKTTALSARVERALASGSPERWLVRPDLAEVAFALLRERGEIEAIDDVEAERAFYAAAGGLLALEWEEFATDGFDPEVPGLRSPERFLSAAFRLIRKLRAALVSPDAFLDLSLKGAAAFYSKPPNLAHPDLLIGTKERYRDSLDVDATELDRQRRREIDLAKILARLYESYLLRLRERGIATPRDAIAEVVALADADPEFEKHIRSRYDGAFVDDAELLAPGELALLQRLFGKALRGVTLAGDREGAFNAFRGARPDLTFAAVSTTIELRERLRARPAQRLQRTSSVPDEAGAIAERVRSLLDGGVAPSEIAVMLRSTRYARAYESALLDRDVPVQIGGDYRLLDDPRALDALALLWNVLDPFRHDWLLRTLANPALALSDGALASLCTEPADGQTALFTIDEEPSPSARKGRWDPRRDLRLGWNVVRGDRDNALDDETRARVVRFRMLREGWLTAMVALPFASFVRKVWSEGLAREGSPDSARARSQQLVLRRLLARMLRWRSARPRATFEDLMADVESRLGHDLEGEPCTPDRGFVRLLDIDAARGLEVEHAFVANVRAGAFPRWYVPDAFLFSPQLGMVAKDNAGDARAARTAKFSYYIHKLKTNQRYNDQERRALGYALARARCEVLVTASGKPTRGIAAPELFEELRARPA